MNEDKDKDAELPLVLQDSHMLETYSRWTDMRNNTKGEHEKDEERCDFFSDDWYFEQCGGCTYYLPLRDPHVEGDWGLCTNRVSAFDRTVMFEHDGCDQFVSTPRGNWVSSYWPKY
jgi:hypothetical protein